MLPHPQARGLEYAQHHQMDQLQAHQNAVREQQQRMAMQRGVMPPPPQAGQGGAQMTPQEQQARMQYQREMQAQQRAMQQPQGGGPQRVSVAPPPSQQQPTRLPPGPIPPSHPSHPSHQAWLAQQHRLQQERQQQNGIPPPPPSSNGSQAPPPGHLQHAQMQQHPQGGVYVTNGGPPPNPNQGPQARSIASAVNLRNGQPPPPQQNPHAVQNGPFAQPSQQAPQNPPLPLPLPPQNASSTPTQSPISVRPPSNHIVGPPPAPSQQQPGPPPTMVQQQQQTGPPVGIGGQRPILRAQMNPQSQHMSLALAAHLAVHGTGPVSATAVPTGTALSRLLALTDALTFALEDENPLDLLRTVVSDYFTDAGVVKFGLYDKTAQLSKVFEIPCSAFPRFQHLNLLHGVLSSTLSPSFIREYRLTTPDTTLHSPSSSNNTANSSNSGPNGGSNSSPPLPQVHIGYLLRADEAVWTSRFSSGTKVDLVGTLTVHLIFKDLGNGQPVLRVESFEFESRGHEEWVVREAMELIQNQNPTTPGAGTAAAGGGGGGSNGSSTTTPMTTTTTIKEEGGGDSSVSSPEKGASSRRSSNSGSQRKSGMTTRRRSASARQEEEHDQESNEDPNSQQEREKEKERKEDNGGAELYTTTSTSSGATSREDQQRRPGPTARIPPSSVGSFGVTEMGMRCLEISESVAQLQDLISFSLETNTGPIQSLAQFAERRRNSLYAGGPTTPSQPQNPSLPTSVPPHHQSQQGYGPPRPTQQSQPNNAFYSSVSTDSPHQQQTNMGPPPQRPPTAGSPATGMNGVGELMSPVALGPSGNGKRKLGNPPPQNHGGNGMEEIESMNGGSEPSSPQKVMRGAGGGRGRGRGR
ncbi:uncharacterized protein JCM6883_007652 [Sporobolomyces salmoneus]|uniref:uncharacterized protein n=1 Tax=Sporobolomyces salmoneus TaxID=183962 RepID=UPI00317BAB03